MVRWDGIIMAVLVSYNGTAKFLSALKIEIGIGKNIAEAVHYGLEL